MAYLVWNFLPGEDGGVHKGSLPGKPETSLFVVAESEGSITLHGSFIPDATAWEPYDAVETAKAAAEMYFRRMVNEMFPFVLDILAKGCGAYRILAERVRQVAVEGWSDNNDDQYIGGELITAAMAYLRPVEYRKNFNVENKQHWPWDEEWWKPSPENRIRELEKVGGLVAAEIDRLRRLEQYNASKGAAKG